MSQRASAEVGDLAAPSSLWDRFVGSWAWPTTVFVLLLVGWEAYVRLSGILPVILPAPSAVLSYMWVQRELLLENAWPTVLHCLLGFVLAVVGGIAIAVLITQFTTIRRGFYPLVVGIALIPKISVAPLFTLWFGAGTVARVSLVFFIAFFPMVVSPASGLMSVDAGLLRMARAFGASRSQIFWSLRVPSAMPYVFDGMKVAMSLAVIGIIVAEFVTADRGLGYLVIFATGLLDTTMMLAAIILLSIIGLGLYFAIETAGRIVVYWRS
ncbi:MAG: ABC transporter permease [Alphaproteobacteria bacterium]|nr:ABC transporter permease [Alphaproteobacteria bacterium]